MLDRDVAKVIAESEDGSFCLLPRHVDFVAVLVRGLLLYTPVGGGEEVLGVDEGVLVKAGDEVLVSTRNAIPGRELGTLTGAIAESFATLEEREKKARTGLAKLQADLIRRIVRLEKA